MLRNLPNNYTRATLLQLLCSQGFGSACTFVYLPIDFTTNAALGYAFVDLVDEATADRFFQVFDGFSKWVIPSRKKSYVSWCGPHQGREAHIERYRNSPVMHHSVPDEYKPVLLEGGRRVPFPEPTASIRAPRVRQRT
jgi:RNA recognition motif-containing protein